MKKKDCCRYYVFDKHTKEFIKENGELATVSEEFVRDMERDIRVLYLTFIEKSDFEDFVNAQMRAEGL